MKKLGISLVALMIGLPTLAHATAAQSPADVTVDTTKHVAATSFVQGAYNALAGVARDHAAKIDANETAIAGKQAQLKNNAGTPANISDTVATSVRATGTADDTTLVTEKAVRDAITNAGGQTAQQVEDAIDAAAGAGIATDGSGKLSVDLTTNGGLELTGNGDAATVGVKVDGTHVVKDASGNVTLSQTDIDNLTAASTALQSDDLAGYATETYVGTAISNAASNYATAAQGALADSAVQSVAEGSTNGTVSVDGTDVAVHGLGSAAYTASSDYATAAQGTKADNAEALLGNTAMGTTATTVTGAIKELKDASTAQSAKQVEVYTTWNDTTTGKADALVDPDPVTPAP